MSITLHKLRDSRSFQVTILLFAAANLWSWLRHRQSTLCCDQEVTVGFPFPFHISGGIAGQQGFYMLGLLLDIVIALTMAFVMMWIAHVLRRLLTAA